jgi:hypothetical protein
MGSKKDNTIIDLDSLEIVFGSGKIFPTGM